MRISVDTNIIVGYWRGTPEGRRDIQEIERLWQQGDVLFVCGVVYIELCATPNLSRAGVEGFLRSKHIALEPAVSPAVWEDAADANHAFQARRRSSRAPQSRRLPADFLIGAHALHHADALMTRNPTDFSDFSGLTLIVPI